ncbi:unnamed protein product [Moneuplotes crassus]|uniref:Uncharacterized protein n=1 Tax=Euplotes crassus TaxID=5936 RepID=A0AAD1UE94_EUPCR|nr:unnamed protein product [Moneuplotes crassus]
MKQGCISKYRRKSSTRKFSASKERREISSDPKSTTKGFGIKVKNNSTYSKYSLKMKQKTSGPLQVIGTKHKKCRGKLHPKGVNITIERENFNPNLIEKFDSCSSLDSKKRSSSSTLSRQTGSSQYPMQEMVENMKREISHAYRKAKRTKYQKQPKKGDFEILLQQNNSLTQKLLEANWEIENKKKENRELNQQLENFKTAQAEILQEKLKQIDTLKKHLLKVSEDAKKKRKDMHEEDSEIFNYKLELEKYKETNFTLQCRLDTNLDRFKQSEREVTDLRWENRDLKKKIIMLEEDNIKMQVRIDSVERNNKEMGSIINNKLNNMAEKYCEKAEEQLKQMDKKSKFWKPSKDQNTDDLMKESQDRISKVNDICTPLVNQSNDVLLTKSLCAKGSQSSRA